MCRLKLCFLLLAIIGLGLAENKYYISSSKSTFLQALSFCRRFGMKFLTIQNEEKNSDLYNHMTRLNESHEWYWTGAIYQNNTMTREWYWIDGDRKVEFADWRQNDNPLEPSYVEDTDNCIRFGLYDITNAARGLWRVDDCSSLRRFICEKPYSDVLCLNCDNSTPRHGK